MRKHDRCGARVDALPWRNERMSWQRRLAPLAVVVAVSGACAGDGGEPGAEQAAPVTTVAQDTSSSTTAPPEQPTTSTPTSLSNSKDDAPETLAFSSSSDLGRLFEVDGSVAPATSAGSDEVGQPLDDGTLVQATNLRARDGEIWVRINSTDLDSTVFGWVAADSLRPTTQSVERFNPNNVTEFRQVSRAVVGDLLDVYSSPGGTGSKIDSMIETEIAMHGGNDVLSASGDRWVDIIEPDTQQRIGWVLASSFTSLTTIEAKSSDGSDVDRRADPSISYGGGISTGTVVAIGCNAQQIQFTPTSPSLGSAIVFGNAVPTGTPLRGSDTVFRWSASGGSTVYVDPGETVTFSFPSQGSKTWYFTTLGVDGQASYATSGGTADLNPSGKAVANNVQDFPVSPGSCAAPELTEPTLNPYFDDLPEEEREVALAAYEEELAEFQANGGVVTNEDAGANTADESDESEAAEAPAEADDGSAEAGDDPEATTDDGVDVAKS